MVERIFPRRSTVGTATILPAKPGDLSAILELMTTVQLPQAGISEAIEHFWIAREGAKIIGSIGVEVYANRCLLRSLAVHPSWQGKGLGKALTETLLAYLTAKRFQAVYLLTTTAEAFFARYGFHPIARDAVPQTVQQSVEFQSACPLTAACMERLLPTSSSSPGADLYIREATFADLPALCEIHNQGILDRVATLDVEPHTLEEKEEWFTRHGPRHPVLVAEAGGEVVGWASLNTFNPRQAYQYVADLSVYVERRWRGKGVGRRLLETLIPLGKALEYHKIVLSAFPFNAAGMRLYQGQGFRTVGIYKEMGLVDGKWVDTIIMEKLLDR
ncbi:MAG: GNAT family N-acetyltransferase [Nitrospinota bacterium]|nr:MAG: GNAT family N-acetyltransferase [Nitrospinota bacterium]